MNRTTIDKKRYLSAFIAVAMLFVGMGGMVNATDVGTSTDTGGGLSVMAGNVAPVITGFTIVDASVASILDAQVDVNTEITVDVTIEDENGWDDIESVKILCWYDGGNDVNAYGFITGDNYNFMLWYDNTVDESVPTIGNMDVESDEAGTTAHTTITEGTHAVAVVTANQKYTLTWKFTLGYQVKQADIPAVADNIDYSNANSWNINIKAADATTTTEQDDSGTDAYEFGIYKYTYVSSASHSWDVGTVAHGANADATAAPVTTRSNDDMDLTVWINADLTCVSPSDTIPTSGSYVKILAAADTDDDIDSDLTYTENLEAGELTILAKAAHGLHSTYMASNSALTTDVNFNIAVPYGTLPGTYTAGLTFQVTQIA
jgi:hypothetical protein